MRMLSQLRLSMLIVCLGTWGALSSCGELHFVISAYAPQQVRVVYSEQEDLTIIAWKLGEQVETGNVRFELYKDGQWTALDFTTSPYPAGEFNCPTTCFQYNLPGRYVAPTNRVVLRSIHPQHGVLISTAASVQVSKTTLSFNPRMKAGNRHANLQITDFFNEIGTPQKRTFQYRFMETSTYPCPTESSSAWTGQTQGGAPVLYGLGTNEAHVCTMVQPIPRRAFKPVTLTGLLWMHPELQSRKTTWNAPVEVSPVLYQLVFDLQIPDADHCARTISSIQQQVSSALDARNSEHHAFEVVNIADNGEKKCRQSADRRFAAVEVAERIKEYVNTSVSQPRGAKVVLIYVNNNSLPLSTALTNDFWTFLSSLGSDPRVSVFTWAIGTGTILNGFEWNATTGWVTPSNSAFREAVTALANSTLPFKTLNHNNDDQVRFLAPEFEGIEGEFKSCGTTPDVTYYLDDWVAVSFPGMTTFVLQLGDWLTFKVNLEQQVFAKSSEFLEQKVLVRYEVCTKWCGHPFYSGGDEWLGSIQGTDATNPGIPLGWNHETRCREAL